MIFFAVFLIALFLVRLWLSVFAGVHPDEAYYWVWSQHLSWGYFDHPPFLAWLIAASRSLVDLFVPDSWAQNNPYAVQQLSLRLLPYFFSTVMTPWFMGRSLEVVMRRPLGLGQMLVLMSLPMYLLGAQIVTPDAPLFTFWSAALLLTLRFQRLRDPDSIAGDPTPFSWSLSLATGVVLGLAGLSKYSALLAAFLVAMTGAGLFNSVVIALVSLAIVAPHLWWNLQSAPELNGGIFFQLKNGLGANQTEILYSKAFEVVGTQFVLWSPAIFLGLFWLCMMNRNNFFAPQKRSRLVGTLFLWGFVPLFFFFLTSLKRPAEANWPLVGAVGATILVLSRYGSRWGQLAFIAVSSFAIQLVFLLAVLQGPFLAGLLKNTAPKLAERMDRPSRLREFSGWDRLHQLLFESVASEPLPVVVHSYQLLSVLLFQDSASASEQRLGDRLKFWDAGSRRSFFDNQPAYLPGELNAYWLLARGSPPVPDFCRIHQSLVKGTSDPDTYTVFLCKNQR